MPTDPKQFMEDDFSDFTLRGPDPVRASHAAPMAAPAPPTPTGVAPDARPRASNGSSAPAIHPCPKCASINISSSFCSGAEALMHRHPTPTRHYQCLKCRHLWTVSAPSVRSAR